MDTISVQQAFCGKTILVTGASGFLGKVWLTMLLDRIPSVGRVYVLLRKKGLRPVSDRFEKIIASTH
ncbi:MAG TPA: dehydrogenase, partial [Myxococcales bacterium]|nr:dehydrogenase [Myxococcales bacterium]